MPRFLAECYKERKEAKQPSLLSSLSPAERGGLDSPGSSPSTRSTNKGAAEDQEVRGWEIPGPPSSTLFSYRLPRKSGCRGERK